MDLKDIKEHHRLRGENCMAALVNILASAVGSLTNPTKLANTFGSNGINVSDKTIGVYIEYLLDAFMINKAERYDIKGKKYIASPFKYYFTDVGLCNAQLNFRQQEENQMMFSFMLTDEKSSLKVCKHRGKVFLASRPNTVFCSGQCKNQYNVKLGKR